MNTKRSEQKSIRVALSSLEWQLLDEACERNGLDRVNMIRQLIRGTIKEEDNFLSLSGLRDKMNDDNLDLRAKSKFEKQRRDRTEVAKRLFMEKGIQARLATALAWHGCLETVEDIQNTPDCLLGKIRGLSDNSVKEIREILGVKV